MAENAKTLLIGAIVLIVLLLSLRSSPGRERGVSCGNYENTSLKDNCHNTNAMNLLDHRQCFSITDRELANLCLDAVSVQTGNKSVCGFIKDYQLKQRCELRNLSRAGARLADD